MESPCLNLKPPLGFAFMKCFNSKRSICIIIGSALFCGVIITYLLKTFRVTSILDGTEIQIADKEKGWKRYLFGGLFFGFGWAISGACPGPMFTTLGAGFFPIIVVIAAATLGTFCYGVLQKHLPYLVALGIQEANNSPS